MANVDSTKKGFMEVEDFAAFFMNEKDVIKAFNIFDKVCNTLPSILTIPRI
jgi:hypothetical protein